MDGSGGGGGGSSGGRGGMGSFTHAYPAILGVMRVSRAFAFVDITGFTAYTEAHGDETAMEMLHTFRGVTRRLASEHAVRIDKWLGDGAMLVATDVTELIQMVLDLKADLIREASALPVRAGIAAGEVLLLEGDDYVGRAVNLAAHLSDAARPDRILVTSETAADAPVDCMIRDAGRIEVAGFEDPLAVTEIVPAFADSPYVAEM